MLLEVDNLRVAYESTVVVRDTTLRVDENEIVALVGPNGAGKSTVLYAISGLLRNFGGSIVAGTVRVDDQVVTSSPGHDCVKAGVRLASQDGRVFSTMTVEENLALGSTMSNDSSESHRNWILSLFPRLKERLGQTAGTLSGGERQMLSIAMALIGQPRLLLADEPSTGLSPNYTESVQNSLKEISSSTEMGILLVEQNIDASLTLSDRGYLFEPGTITMEGSASKIRQALGFLQNS